MATDNSVKDGEKKDVDQILEALEDLMQNYSQCAQINQKYLMLNVYYLFLKPEQQKEFMSKPHKSLQDIGMAIPDDAVVIFDTAERRWPDLNVLVKEGEYRYTELPNAVVQTTLLESGQIELQETSRSTSGSEKLRMNIPERSDHAKVIVRLPWFIPGNDMITEYKFEDGEEVLLSCC